MGLSAHLPELLEVGDPLLCEGALKYLEMDYVKKVILKRVKGKGITGEESGKVTQDKGSMNGGKGKGERGKGGSAVCG